MAYLFLDFTNSSYFMRMLCGDILGLVFFHLLIFAMQNIPLYNSFAECTHSRILNTR